jgi:hypothetical protein
MPTDEDDLVIRDELEQVCIGACAEAAGSGRAAFWVPRSSTVPTCSSNYIVYFSGSEAGCGVALVCWYASRYRRDKMGGKTRHNKYMR